MLAMFATIVTSASIVQGRIGNGAFNDPYVPNANAYGLDFNNDGELEFSLSYNNTSVAYTYEENGTNIWNEPDNWDIPYNVPVGTVIGSVSSWGGYGDCAITGWSGPSALPVETDVYLGMRIKYADGLHYGWAKVRISGTEGNYSAEWIEIYYETEANTSINAGETGGSIPPTTYTVTVSANPASAGTVTGSGSYAEGNNVSVTATANNGYRFLNWTEDGAVVSTNTTYVFQLTADCNLVANFEEDQTPASYEVIVLPIPNAGGTAYGGGIFTEGSEVTVSAVPNSGYRFVNWADNYGTVTSENATYTFVINSDITLFAYFEEETTAIDENETAKPIISSENLIINVRNAENKNIAIYDINGRLIINAQQNSYEKNYSVPASGIYIVNIGAKSEKIVVSE